MGFIENRLNDVKKEIQRIGKPREDSEAFLLQSKLALLTTLLKYPPYQGAANDETFMQGEKALKEYRNEQHENQRPAREQHEKEEEMVFRYTTNPKLLNDLSADELIDLKLMIKSSVDNVEDEKRALFSFTQKARDFLSREHPKSAGVIDFVSQLLSEAPSLDKRKRFLELIEEKIKRANAPNPEEDKRTKAQNRIRSLKVDKAKDVEGMREQGEDEESVKRRENMWDDAISREEEELRRHL